MNHCVEIRGIRIGEGAPRICVPIVERTKSEIRNAAATICTTKADIAEWRADWFDGTPDFALVRDVLTDLRATLDRIPLLFTCRTAKEGGETAIAPDAYASLNKAVAATGLVDLIDVELFTGDEIVRDIIAFAHAHNTRVIVSNHDFHQTPDKDELIRRLLRMQELGADIPKIAVMPRCRKDVLTLLEATREMSEEYADRPIITMSMSGTGLVSRLCGEVFGSALTFGAVGKTSAPGQIDASELHAILTAIHRNL